MKKNRQACGQDRFNNCQPKATAHGAIRIAADSTTAAYPPASRKLRQGNLQFEHSFALKKGRAISEFRDYRWPDRPGHRRHNLRGMEQNRSRRTRQSSPVNSRRLSTRFPISRFLHNSKRGRLYHHRHSRPEWPSRFRTQMKR